MSFDTQISNDIRFFLMALHLYEQNFLYIDIFHNILYLPPKTDISTSKNPKKGYLVRFFCQKTTHLPAVNADK